MAVSSLLTAAERSRRSASTRFTSVMGSPYVALVREVPTPVALTHGQHEAVTAPTPTSHEHRGTGHLARQSLSALRTLLTVLAPVGDGGGRLGDPVFRSFMRN